MFYKNFRFNIFLVLPSSKDAAALYESENTLSMLWEFCDENNIFQIFLPKFIQQSVISQSIEEKKYNFVKK